MARIASFNRPFVILVTGDREWTDFKSIMKILATYQRKYTFIRVVHGDARGADRLARDAAYALGLSSDQVIPFPAEWDKYGKAAGPRRNRQMFFESNPDVVLAFHDNLAKSKGTKDMVQLATQQRTKVRYFKHKVA